MDVGEEVGDRLGVGVSVRVAVCVGVWLGRLVRVEVTDGIGLVVAWPEKIEHAMTASTKTAMDAMLKSFRGRVEGAYSMDYFMRAVSLGTGRQAGRMNGGARTGRVVSRDILPRSEGILHDSLRS